MKNRLLTLALVLLASASAAFAVDYTPKYTLINNPDYPTNDLAVATYNLMDYGADNTGQKDCTSLINTLLKKLNGVTGLGSIGTYSYITGGILYIPAGRYLITGQINVPRGVTIRGDWRQPDESGVHGTVLVIRPRASLAGNTDDTNAAIRMQPTSEISNIAFWYPDQRADNVTAYPPTVCYGYPGYWGNDYCNVRHATFVNSYIGIKFLESNGGGCPNIFDIYGTPLYQGVVMDNIADVGRFDHISFSPRYWAESGLDGAPSEATIRQLTKSSATGFVMRRNDRSYTCNYAADGYNVGFSAESSTASPGSRPNGHCYNLTFTDCTTGIDLSDVSGSGIMFTRANTSGCHIGVRSRGGIGPVQFLDCDIQGNTSIYTDLSAGVGLMLQDCSMSGKADIMGGQFTSINCQYDADVTIGPMSRTIFTGNTFTGGGQLVNNSMYTCQVSDAPVATQPLPEYKDEWMAIKETRPARAALYVVTDAEFGAKPVDIKTELATQSDNSVAIQAALDKAGREGGGIVYLPAGHYRMDHGLTIPAGVELKGAGDVASVPKGNGAILEVYGVDEGNENANAFIMMGEGSGLRGVHFNYPKQTDINNIKKYPYTIRGNKDCYIVNVAARTAYRILDLFTNKCDNHYVDYLAGHAFMNVVRIGGGSENGLVSNIQCNTIVHACGDETKFGAWPNSAQCKDDAVSAKVYGQNNEQLEFLTVGDCDNEVLYNNFLFGCNKGMEFVADNGRAATNVHALGNAVDGAVNSVVVSSIGTDLDLINSQIVAINHDKSAQIISGALPATFITLGYDVDKQVNLLSSNLWGGGDYMCDVKGGTLNMNLANMAASGAKWTFNVASSARMNMVGGYVQKTSKVVNNATSASGTTVTSTVLTPTGQTGTWKSYTNDLPVEWTLANKSAFLDRTGWVASSNLNNGNAYKAIDGNATTRWDTSKGQSSADGTWFNVDMKQSVSFNTVLLDASGSSNDGPGKYTVQIYNNGTWTTVAEGENGSAMTAISLGQTVTASQVRVTLSGSTKGNYWSIHEFYLATLDYVTAIRQLPTAAIMLDASTRADIYTVSGTKLASCEAPAVQQTLSSMGQGIYLIRYTAESGATKTVKVARRH